MSNKPENKKPKWAPDATPEQIKTFVKTCKKIKRDQGCSYVDCDDCPGDKKYNNGFMCESNGFCYDAAHQAYLDYYDTPTQENEHTEGHQEYQVETTLNGEQVWVDPELMELLSALNNAGLITRSHCSGHGKTDPWVAIRADNIENIEIRKDGTYNEVILRWKK